MARSSEDLARATGAHEPSLYRVLRVLAALGVLQESESRSFSLTVVGDRLRSDAPVGMRSWATFLEALGGVRPFAHILETIKTGKPGLDIEFGTSVFGYLTEHPHDFATFNAAMSERTASFAFSVADTYDFSDTRKVVDLGGGNGTLLVEILRQNAHLTGVLLEIPAVAAHADAILDATDIANRCEVLAGDFFQRVPAGADCYVLANVLHDWDDRRSIEILRNCRQAMPGAGKVLIVERLIPENGDDPLPNPAQRHQHADAHRRPRTHERRIRQASRGGRPDARHHPASCVPLRRNRGPDHMNAPTARHEMLAA